MTILESIWSGIGICLTAQRASYLDWHYHPACPPNRPRFVIGSVPIQYRLRCAALTRQSVVSVGAYWA